jgi:hypothetical protein
MVMPNNNASVGTSNGSSISVNLLLAWALYHFAGINIPNEVSIALTGLLTTIFHWWVKRIEAKAQFEMNAYPLPAPGDPATTKP